MVVAGDDQHATVLCTAGRVGVVEHVAAAIHARPLAVPHGEHAIVFGTGEQVQLLRAPDGGSCEVFVDPGLKHDVVALQMLFRCPEGLVNAAQRAAAITGNESGGIESGGLIAQSLQHGQAYEGL